MLKETHQNSIRMVQDDGNESLNVAILNFVEIACCSTPQCAVLDH